MVPEKNDEIPKQRIHGLNGKIGLGIGEGFFRGGSGCREGVQVSRLGVKSMGQRGLMEEVKE